MTAVLRLPDDAAALLEQRASQRGLTLTELVSELARMPTDRQALEAFIGCVDIHIDEPFDIHQARTGAVDEFLRDFDDRSTRRGPPLSTTGTSAPFDRPTRRI